MSPEVTFSNCEDPIRQAGWGLYHHFMIGMASACAFSQASAMTSIPFAMPLAICDTTNSESTITAMDVCFSFGMAFGGLILTSVSDLIGRKCLIPLSLIIIFASTFACGFAHGNITMLIFVFVLGCGLAANASCVKIHLSEILPAKRRGLCLVIPDLFWSFGFIISSLAAWLLTPSIIHNQKLDMRLTSWRLMFGLSGACSIMVACASALLQPSPRFLLSTKRYPEALDTLKHIYAVNSSRHCETYSVRLQDLEGRVDDFNLNNEPAPNTCTEHLRFSIKRMRKLMQQIFKARFIRVTMLLIFIKFAVLFGMLTINIWLAKMLRLNNDRDCHISAIDILHLESASDECKFNLSSSLYRDFFVIAANIVVGQVILLLTIDRQGRRIAIISGCVACGVSSFALGYVRNVYAVQLAASIIFMMAYSVVDSALNVVVIEAYPTAFRGTASGGTQFFARFAGGFVKRFLQTPCQSFFIIIGAVMLAAAVLGYFLPELRGQAMVE